MEFSVALAIEAAERWRQRAARASRSRGTGLARRCRRVRRAASPPWRRGRGSGRTRPRGATYGRSHRPRASTASDHGARCGPGHSVRHRVFVVALLIQTWRKTPTARASTAPSSTRTDPRASPTAFLMAPQNRDDGAADRCDSPVLGEGGREGAGDGVRGSWSLLDVGERVYDFAVDRNLAGDRVRDGQLVGPIDEGRC